MEPTTKFRKVAPDAAVGDAALGYSTEYVRKVFEGLAAEAKRQGKEKFTETVAEYMKGSPGSLPDHPTGKLLARFRAFREELRRAMRIHKVTLVDEGVHTEWLTCIIIYDVLLDEASKVEATEPCECRTCMAARGSGSCSERGNASSSSDGESE